MLLHNQKDVKKLALTWVAAAPVVPLPLLYLFYILFLFLLSTRLVCRLLYPMDVHTWLRGSGDYLVYSRERLLSLRPKGRADIFSHNTIFFLEIPPGINKVSLYLSSCMMKSMFCFSHALCTTPFQKHRLAGYVQYIVWFVNTLSVFRCKSGCFGGLNFS